MPDQLQNDDLVMNLVELALARPPEYREAYLRSACSSDPQLFKEVWKYVQWEQRMNGFLLEPLYPPASSEAPFEPGQTLVNRFRIVRKVGEGGMAVVYEAYDERLGRSIAIKCAKTGFHKRLPPEVRHASEISHPNVCKIFEIHTASTDHGEVDFLTMEFLEGPTLAERFLEGALPDDEARTIAQQLCAALAEAHRNQVIHGDLKSNNIILAREPDGAIRAVITDFGLARRPGAQQPAGQSGEVGGALAYMAPELLRGEKPSTASDIYALGVVLYELVSGRRPFSGEVSWEERLTRPPAPLKHRWKRTIQRCLNPDLAHRFANVPDVALALEPTRSRRWFLAAAAAAILAVATGAVTYQRAAAPQEAIRLAVLPFQTDTDTAPLTEGLLLDTGDRLSRLKPGHKRLTLIPLGDALQNKVDKPAAARTMLGATHTLSGTLHKESGRLEVRAYLTDLRTLVNLKEWEADYAPGEVRNLPVALAGMVTGTLRLPPLAMAATVNAAAYTDFAAGVSLARRDDGVDRALPLLEHAVSADPNSPLTQARLAEAELLKYRLTNDEMWFNRALASLKNAEERNPDVAVVRFVSGTLHDVFGHYELAEADFRRAIDLEPSNGDAWRALGRAYENNNQPNEAKAAYLKAIEVQPEYFRNFLDLGNYYFSRGEYEEAVGQFKRMVQLAPNLARAHYALATPYLAVGRYADAEYELRIAISLQETASVFEGLGLSLMLQDRDREAIRYFKRAVEIGLPSEQTSLYYINLGTSLRRANLPRESEQAYRKGRLLAEAALVKNPRDAYERSSLAYLCARLGEPRRAESEAAQAVQLSGGANNVRWMAALTYEALEEHDRTLALIRDAPGALLDRLNRFPDLAELRADPRFQQLVGSHHIR
jgi:tetratricopeptide (TPR) repeat protein